MGARLGSATVVAVTGGFAAAAALAAPVGPTGSATGYVSAVSCPTARICLAVGESSSSEVLDTLRDGKQIKVRKVVKAKNLQGISCPSLSFCALIDSGRDTYLTLSHGRLSKPARLRFSPTAVSCPGVGKCVFLGVRPHTAGATLEARVLSAGTLSAPVKHNFGLRLQGGPPSSLSCSSLTACEAVGGGGGGSSAVSYYFGVDPRSGFGTAHTFRAQRRQLGDVACFTASKRCYLSGVDKGNVGHLWSLKIGGGRLKQLASPSHGPRLACRSAKLCVLADRRGVVPYTDGKLGPEQSFSSQFTSNALSLVIARPSRTHYIVLSNLGGSFSSAVIYGKL